MRRVDSLTLVFSLSRQTLHQEVEQDEAEAAADGDDNGCDDEVSTGSEGVSEEPVPVSHFTG